MQSPPNLCSKQTLMLSRLTLENWQVHESLELTFDPHITIIKGPNDSGKSSIVRALKWVSGHTVRDFSTHGQDGATVVEATYRSRTDPDQVLVVKRVFQKNRYLFYVNGVSYEGARLPEELEIASFICQFDPLFWVASSKRELAEDIDRVTKANVFSAAESWISKERFGLREAISQTRRRLEITEKRLEVLASLPHYQEKVQQLQALVKRRSYYGRVFQLFQEARALRRAVASPPPPWEPLEQKMETLKRISRVLEIYEEAKRLASEKARLLQALHEKHQALSRFRVCPLCGAPLHADSSCG